MNPIKQFSPGDKWSNPDGTLTERAKGYLRSISDFTGASAGYTPPTVGAAVVDTAATTTTPYGYATQAQADAIVTRLNEIRAALIAYGVVV